MDATASPPWKESGRRDSNAGRRCHHLAGGEHSATTGTGTLKMKMSLDLHQGVTGLPALEPQIPGASDTQSSRSPEPSWDCFTDIPRLKSRTCSLMGDLYPHTLPFTTMPAINLMEGQYR